MLAVTSGTMPPSRDPREIRACQEIHGDRQEARPEETCGQNRSS